MQVTLLPLTVAHLRAMGETDRLQNWMRMRGPGFTLFADGRPIGAGGIVRLWDNVGKAWTLHTEEARASALLMRRIEKAVRQQIPIVRDAMKLERLECETLAQPKYCSWLSRLGFIWEGEMPKYKDGETYARFAWVRGR